MAVLLVLLALAQNPVVNPRAGDPLMFQADEIDPRGEWVTLYSDGVRLTHVSMAAVVNGTVTIDVPQGLPAGQHLMEAETCNSSFGCSVRAQLTITIDPAIFNTGVPSPPKRLRLIIK